MKHLSKIALVLLLLFSAAGRTLAQGNVEEDAKKQFNNKNYKAALAIYLNLLKADPKNIELNLKAAQCYLLSKNMIRAKAIPHLEFITKQPNCDNEAWLYLGKAYHFGNKFDDAIKCYTKYKEKAPTKEWVNIDRLIEQANNGKILVKKKLDVTFENCGKDVNSDFPDYYPIITPDEQTLVFTTRRKSGGEQIEFDGYYPSDIFIAAQKPEGKWGKAGSIGPGINGNLDEEAVGMSADGNTLLFYIDHDKEEVGDIYQAKRLNGKAPFLKPFKLPEQINSDFESAACLILDDDGMPKTIFFASNRAGGFGGTDIYVCRILPNGNWGTPQNLGPTVNTKYNEDFPQITEDGKTLYFASEGHSSMGGYDVFKSKLDEETNQWGTPENIGYPLNDANDNMIVSFARGGRICYLSTVREDGIGDLDIYRCIINDVQGKEVIYRGYIVPADSAGGKKLKDAVINVTDKKTNELYGTYVPSPSSGYYVISLPPGKYEIQVEATGYKPYKEVIAVIDRAYAFCPEVAKDIKLLR